MKCAVRIPCEGKRGEDSVTVRIEWGSGSKGNSEDSGSEGNGRDRGEAQVRGVV